MSIIVCQHPAWRLARNRSSANICCTKEGPSLGKFEEIPKEIPKEFLKFFLSKKSV